MPLAAMAVVALIVPIGALVGPVGRAVRPSGDHPPVAAVLGELPLAFEANEGQFGPDIRFVAQAHGHRVLLTDSGLAVATPGSDGSMVGLTLEGARSGFAVEGQKPLAGRTHRLVGDPGSWRTDLANYGAVSYREVYPGIDVLFYGNGSQVEHDFVVAPGANPGVIRLAVSGATGSRIDANGDLVLPSSTDEIRLLAPQLFQEVDGRRRPVTGSYRQLGDGRFGFAVGAYDTSLPLVIDPVLVSASYLGGSSTDTAYGVALDVDGNIVIAGYTESSDFPTLNPTQPGLVQADGARTDVFVSKVKADGSSLLWSTYLGGRSRDAAFAVAVGSDSTVYVTGYSESSDFPMVRAIQGTNSGGASDVFVAKLNSAGSALEYSTFLGGRGADSASGVAVDSSGAAYVVGSTGSADFPMARPFQASLSKPDDVDGFVAKIAPGGATLAYSSYLGGGGDDHAIDVAVDAQGSAFVVGDTRSTNFPTLRPLQAAPGGGTSGSGTSSFADAFVVKVKEDGTGLTYGTYLGGSDSDKATAVAVDAQGNAFVTGNTGSPNFPVLSAAQPKKDGDFDAFVTKLKADGSALAYSTYLGGSGSDGGEGLVVGGAGQAFVTGATASANFPTEEAFQGAKGGGFVDAFVTELNAAGDKLSSSSYLGGRDDDQAAAVALDKDGNIVIIGYTNSADFPIAKPFQAGKGGGVGDAFVAKVREEGATAASGGAPAASKREERVRLLVTVTGGLFIAAVMHTVWLRRRPSPDAGETPAPRLPEPAVAGGTAGGAATLPGVRYLPGRDRLKRRKSDQAVTPTGREAKRAIALDDRKRKNGVEATSGAEKKDETERFWGPVTKRKRAEVPAWDQPERPLLRPLERPAEPVGTPRITAPDLWGSDAPLAEAAASVRAGRGPGGWGTVPAAPAPPRGPAAGSAPLPPPPGSELTEGDRWPTEARAGGQPDGDLDPLDSWGPLVEAQEPGEWVDKWGVTPAEPPVGTGRIAAPPPPPPPPLEPPPAPDVEWMIDIVPSASDEAAEVAAAADVAQATAAAEAAAAQAHATAAAEAAKAVAETAREAAQAAQRAAEEAAEWAAEAEAAEAAEAAEWAAEAEVASVAAARAVSEAERAAQAAEAAQVAAAHAARATAAQAAVEAAQDAAARAETTRSQVEAAVRARAAAEAQAAAAQAAAAQADAAHAAQAQAAQAAHAARAVVERAAREQDAHDRAMMRVAVEAAAASVAAAQAEADAEVEAAWAAAHPATTDETDAGAEEAAEPIAEAEARATTPAAAEDDAASSTEPDVQSATDVEGMTATAPEAGAEAASSAAASVPDEAGSAAQEEPDEAARAQAEEVGAAQADEARAAQDQAARAAEQEAARAQDQAARAAQDQAARAAEQEAARAAQAQQEAARVRAQEEAARAAEREAARAQDQAARAAQDQAARAAEQEAARAAQAQQEAARVRAQEEAARAAQAQQEAARAAQAREAAARAARAAAEARAREEAVARAAQAEEAARAQEAARLVAELSRMSADPDAATEWGPPPSPSGSPANGPRRELSLSELLDEDLPIPELAATAAAEPERLWIDDLLDEDFPIPDAPGAAPATPDVQDTGAGFFEMPVDAPAPPAAARPAPPPPQPPQPPPPAAPPTDEEDAEDDMPVAPARLLVNLFEPDPDDPLVQATRSHESERHRRRDGRRP